MRSTDQTLQQSLSDASYTAPNNPSLLVETVGPSFLASSTYDSAKGTGGHQTDSDIRTSKLPLRHLTGTIKEERREDDESENQSERASQEGVRDVTASNSFLMRIVHGRVPNQLL